MMFWKVICGGIEDGEGSEVSMKGFAMKASMSEMVSLGEERDERMGVNIFTKAFFFNRKDSLQAHLVFSQLCHATLIFYKLFMGTLSNAF